MTDKMEYWFSDINQIFRDFDKYTIDAKNKRKRRIFIDNGADVLLVSHLDTVQMPALKKQKKGVIYGSGFDDRIGCFLAYTLSRRINVDVLITDLEEKGNSTAQHHDIKDYNFVVGLDREGTDVVTYDFYCPELETELEKYFDFGFGSFSDICYIAGNAGRFNLGIGHYGSHSTDAMLCLDDMASQVRKFLCFFDANKDRKFVCEKMSLINDYGYADYGLCEICDYETANNIYGLYVCRDCFHFMVNEIQFKER